MKSITMASPIFQLISKKLVKPSVQTPPSLRNYKLSLLDQLMNDRYMPIAYFFPNQSNKHTDNTSQVSSDLLQESLSKTLASYYPFAGRLIDNSSVHCNDMGATFLEARIKCPMSEILKRDADIVFPTGLPWSSAPDQLGLVVAQLSHFDCGGKALSVCMRHKIGDGYTLCNFINDWAAMARHQSNDQKPLPPQFLGASILPPKDDDPPNEAAFDLKQDQHSITRRFVFDIDKINQLKAKASAESGLQNPTRVEVVSALLFKSAMSATMACSGSFKPGALDSIVNLRPLLGLVTTQSTYVGNIDSRFIVFTTDERDMNFSRLVSKIRRQKLHHFEKYKGIKTNDLVSSKLEEAQHVKLLQDKNDINDYTCSSLCRYPTYNIDFGWGRPMRVNLAESPRDNHFVLMDNHTAGGIEALVNLEEQVMSVFQSDSELLAFASYLSF